MLERIPISADRTLGWIRICYVSGQPAMVKFCKRHFVVSKGGAIMSFVVIGSKDFRFRLSRKVFDWLLFPFHRHYKNKRPPPVTGKAFDASISIRFPQLNHPFGGKK